MVAVQPACTVLNAHKSNAQVGEDGGARMPSLVHKVEVLAFPLQGILKGVASYPGTSFAQGGAALEVD